MPAAGLFPFSFLNTSFFFLCLNFDTPFISLLGLPIIFVSNCASCLYQSAFYDIIWQLASEQMRCFHL